MWFVSEFVDPDTGAIVNAETIRASLGDFSPVIHCPALYGARLSQAFSATEPSLRIRRDELKVIPDIRPKIPDGVQVVSSVLSEEIDDSGLEMDHVDSVSTKILEAIEDAFDMEYEAPGQVYKHGLQKIASFLRDEIETHGLISQDNLDDVAERLVEKIEASEDAPLFTDGVGTISEELLDDVWSKICDVRGVNATRMRPSALQVRVRWRFAQF